MAAAGLLAVLLAVLLAAVRLLAVALLAVALAALGLLPLALLGGVLLTRRVGGRGGGELLGRVRASTVGGDLRGRLTRVGGRLGRRCERGTAGAAERLPVGRLSAALRALAHGEDSDRSGSRWMRGVRTP